MEITKDIVLDAVRRAPAHGWKLNEIADELGLGGKGVHRIKKLVGELKADGTIERAPGARYRMPGMEAPPAPPQRPAAAKPATEAAKDGVVGRIRVHPAGYGFVEREDGEADVFVPARFRGPALDGDKVKVATWLGYKGTEGRVIEVITRGRAKLTGTVRQVGRHFVLEPDDPRIASTYGQIALEEGAERARDGQAAVVEITRYPTAEAGELAARVWKVLGDVDDPRTEVEKVIHVAEIPDTFP